MNLILRVIYVFLSSIFKKKLRLPEENSELGLMVLPTDLDSNWHMNNGRYLTIMDLGRLDLILRSGILKMMLHHKAVPILSAATIRYRLPLHPFQSYILQTRIIWWDKKWAYIEQRFLIHKGEKAGAVAAIALVKGNFFCKKTKSVMPIETVLESIGQDNVDAPACPKHLKDWMDAEESLRAVTKS